MNNLSVKKNNFSLIFFVLLGLFISENLFATPYWDRARVAVILVTQQNTILISTGVYDYSQGPTSVHAYLQYIKFEASVDKENYFNLMQIETKKQRKYSKTKVSFKYKKDNAKIIFTNSYQASETGVEWFNYLKENIQLTFPNTGNLCFVGLKWLLGQEFCNVRFIRTSGIWQVCGQNPEYFHDVIYDLKNPTQNKLNSKTQGTIRNESDKNSANVLKYSADNVIPRADITSNIKVYSTSGLEMKSVILKNDIVKTNFPSNQIYIVHIGNLRY